MRKALILLARVRHSRLVRLLGGVLVSVALFLSLAALAPSRAHAASLAPRSAPCNYSAASCDGLDPYMDPGPGGISCGHTDAELLVQWNIKYGYVQEWGSNICGTKWAVTTQYGHPGSSLLPTDAYINRINTDGSITTYDSGNTLAPTAGWSYSPMVFTGTYGNPNDNPVPAQACGSINKVLGGDGDGACLLPY